MYIRFDNAADGSGGPSQMLAYVPELLCEASAMFWRCFAERYNSRLLVADDNTRIIIARWVHDVIRQPQGMWFHVEFLHLVLCGEARNRRKLRTV